MKGHKMMGGYRRPMGPSKPAKPAGAKLTGKKGCKKR